MKQYRYIYFLIIGMMTSVFLISMMSFSVFGELTIEKQTSTVKHVLLINAYHLGFGWTDEQTNAIIETLTTYDPKLVISVEYLDWKRYPENENIEQQYELLKYKYKNKHIDGIITTDDIAMDFAINYREEIFNNAPIVFTGVLKESAEKRMAGVKGITGVYEKLDAFGTVQLIERLAPETRYVYIITDYTESGLDVGENIRLSVEKSSMNLEYEILNQQSYQQILEILKYPKANSVAIMGTFTMDSLHESMPNESFMRMIAEETDIPVFTTYEYIMGYGAIGGSLLSGTMQGEVASKSLISYFEGIDINAIPIVVSNTVYYGFDYPYLIKHQIDVDMLPENSIIMNKPFSFYETYKSIIWLYSAIILSLAGLLLILAINIGQRRKVQQDIEKQHIELVTTYEALTASEEELKAQNEELIEQQEQINELAYSDYLTKLPNRFQMKKNTLNMIHKYEHINKKMLLAFIDIDNFNYVNTAHGHHIGDTVLESIAERFRTYVSHDGCIGRIGGDEFIYIKGIESEIEIEGYIQGILNLFEDEVQLDENDIYVSASIGYAVYPDDGLTYDDLLIRADLAMYKMKAAGKAKASRFDLTMDFEMKNKIQITNALHNALGLGEFHLVYQPQFHIGKKRIVGFEALIRWENCDLGFIPPSQFIPLLEGTGGIIDVGTWVMHTAAQFAVLINKDIPIVDDLIPVSINISVVQLLRVDFIDIVISVIERYQVRPEWLEFEITESIFIESFELANSHLSRLKELGISIALDDFGTGYSSLTYLKKLPISTLKIDKTFIDDIILEGDNHFFTSSIIEIAHKLGFRVVSEGVESEEQLKYLENYNCQIIQGYWFSKPVSESEALALCNVSFKNL